MNGRPSCSPISWIVQMCGWFSADAVRASRRNRSRATAEAVRCRRENLDRDEAIEPRIAGFVHLRPCPRGQDFVRTEAEAAGNRHNGLRKLYGGKRLETTNATSNLRSSRASRGFRRQRRVAGTPSVDFTHYRRISRLHCSTAHARDPRHREGRMVCAAFCGLPCSRSVAVGVPRPGILPTAAGLRGPVAPAAAQAGPSVPAPKIWVGRYAEFEDVPPHRGNRADDQRVDRRAGDQARLLQAGRAGRQRALCEASVPGRYDGFWESYKGDIAAYKLDRLLELDMVPPTVERRYNGEMVSLQVWAQNMKMLKEVQEQKLRPSNLEPYNFQLRRQKVFQNLVGNIDPNQGNILFDPVWNVILIDFSRAFTNTRS